MERFSLGMPDCLSASLHVILLYSMPRNQGTWITLWRKQEARFHPQEDIDIFIGVALLYFSCIPSWWD